MFKLEQKAYAAVQTLLTSTISTHAAVAAVLDGTTTGSIWVDDRKTPAVALVEGGGGFFLAGAADRRRSFAPLRKRIPAWAYLFPEAQWTAVLGEIWANRFARPHARVRLGLEPGASAPRCPGLPEGFRLAPVDAALLQASPCNIDAVAEVIDGWRSPELFLSRGIGFCVLQGDRIVSHCLSDNVTGNRCELGVGTEPEFRRLGLGRAAAAAAVAESLRRGITGIEWHSHASNKGSIAIARGVGLVELDRHVAFSGSLPAENVGDLDLATCLDWARHLDEAALEIGWYGFHAAGAWALAGDRARALASLRRLVEDGWDGEAEWLEDHWALASLRGDEGFESIVAAQRQAA